MDCIVSSPSFAVPAVTVDGEQLRSAFVTRVLGELQQDGWIVCDESSANGRESGSVWRWNSDKGPFSATQWIDRKVFGVQVTSAPEQDRPRERLLAVGAENLTLAELLAILIRSGRPGESAVMGGEKIARKFSSQLQNLPAAGRGELKEISSTVEKTAYCQIMAGAELGRRIAAVSADRSVEKITSASDAKAWCRRNFLRLAADAKQEEFHIVTLNTKNQVIDTHEITVGTLDASLVHPREVFRPAIKDAAAAVILVHNHPSGDPTPSREDISVTRRLETAGEVLGIEVLDHIVLGHNIAVSIRET